ncbi:DUF6482 family protein [Salinicola halophilus]|uniref:DUF6482 family protein n=1 Tax=Salinicola halophilus TaxID=184065 RepID=UPI000DA1E6E8|nr:DUF6482 family protein [Salinicola halophilus]
MKFDAFVQLLESGAVSELHVESVKPMSYHYRAMTDGHGVVLLDDDGKLIRERSLREARQRLEGISALRVLPVYLVEHTTVTTRVGSRICSSSRKTRLTLGAQDYAA